MLIAPGVQRSRSAGPSSLRKCFVSAVVFATHIQEIFFTTVALGMNLPLRR